MISIVIPTYNEEQAIGETIRHLKEGIKTIPYEVIVADDNSTDKTREIAKKYSVIISPSERKNTIASGKNRGAKKAKGEYIIFLDADVKMKEPEKFLKKALKNFEDNPNLAGLGSFIRVTPEKETKSDVFFRTLHNKFNFFMNNIIPLGTGAGEFQMVRKDRFQKINGFNEKLNASEDGDLFNRLARIGQVRFDKSLVVYEEGRRAHKLGWTKLYSIWILNGIMMMLFRKTITKEWTVIR